MRKRYIALILAIIATISCLCGCKNKEDTSAAGAYLDMAQTFIDNNDYASAMEILQKGFAETKDSRIAVLIAELSATTPTDIATVPTTESQNDPLVPFVGTWANEDISWEYGGLILDIEAADSDLTVKTLYLQSEAFRIATFDVIVSEENLQGDTLEFNFENDGWDNAGTITLQLSDGTILCTIKDVTYIGNDGFALWGIYDGEYVLTMQEDAHEKVSQPENSPTESQEAVTRPLTMEERKANCYMLSLSWADFMDATTLNPISYADLGPQHINMSFVPCQTRTYYVICPRCLGSDHEGGDPTKGACNNKGYGGDEETKDGIHYILQGDPNQAVTKPVTVSEVLTYPNGTLVYRLKGWEYGSANIYDHREDQSIPITKGTVLVPYMTYLGDVDNVSEFSLFTCNFVN